jgi:hypothetical protein
MPPSLVFRTFRKQQPTLAEIRAVPAGAVRAKAFSLPEERELRIEATGADNETIRRLTGGRNFIARLVMSLMRRDEHFEDEVWPGNAWILDADTREIVWELRGSEADRDRHGLLRYEAEIELPRGNYEAYYAFFPVEWNFGDDGWKSWLTGEGDGERSFRQLGLEIRGNGRSLGDVSRAALNDPTTVVSFNRVGDDAHERIGFVLERPAEIEIRALGEASGSTTYDYGWVIDANTRERIWQFTYEDSDPAGGAEKNRVSRTRVTLPAGRYAAFFVTDDSHSPASWNSAPPYDPFRYGLTIRVTDPASRGAIRTFEYEPAPRDQAIAALTGVRDSEYRSQGFTLKKAMGVRVFALGEGMGDEMYDRAWITSGPAGRTVWEMTMDATEHAGGAEKNRLFDGVIRLEPGSYVVHYATDDSHATDAWNDAPPADRNYWGVTLLPSSGALDRDAVVPYDPADDPAIIARLTGIRDNQVSRRRFTMPADGAVRVYALGEGMGDEMYDFAWIEDTRTGDRMWEMRYADTEHAGGADKNRLFDGAIRLARGEYELVYRTDDSHAFGAWNSEPPRDVASWGVTLFRMN